MNERESQAQGRKFSRIATAGILFQGGAATVDTGTIVAGLVHGLTSSPFAVGAAAAISRYGWLFSQIFVAHVAQGRTRRMSLYCLGAFGRAAFLAGLALLLWKSAPLSQAATTGLFFALWTAYAFVGGIVAVPYNDIVARSIPSDKRSRLLAVRFFGGGLLALLVAALARSVLQELPFPANHGLVFLGGSLLLTASAVSFVSAGEAPAPAVQNPKRFAAFLAEGVRVFLGDTRFRWFLYSRWLGGVVTMALPFYFLLANTATLAPGDTALFVVFQTAGSLVSNPLWGWWGDRRGKASLLLLTAAAAAFAPALALLWTGTGWQDHTAVLIWFGCVFFVIGAVGNGDTIALLGYLMEISPEERRPAYSGYFNLMAAPAALLPLAAASLVEAGSFPTMFSISFLAALLQLLTVKRLLALSN